MDREIIFFIIFVVFSILSSLLNRKKKAQRPPQSPSAESQTADPQRKKRPFTFEDILREFEVEIPEQKQPQPEEVYDEQRYDEVDERHDPFSYADEDKEKSSAYETYEGATYDTAEVVNPELDKKLERLKNSEIYALSEQVTNEYAEELADPDGLRKAIVMKEILDRKYF